MAAFKGWEPALLRALGAPVSANNLRALEAWQRSEGGSAAFNPLNTTQPAHGAGRYNSVGVRSYASPQEGLRATLDTLLNGHYGQIVSDLRHNANPGETARAVGASPWGTSGALLMNVLGSTPTPATPSVGAAASGRANPISAAPPAPPAPAAPDFRKQIALALMAQVGEKTPDYAGVYGLLGRQRDAQAQAQATPSPLPPPEAPAGPRAQSPRPGAPGASLNELFYDPLGGIKHGKSIGAIGGHSDHVHVALSTLAAQLAAEQRARALGLHVGEEQNNDTNPVHAKNSYHYQNFPGSKYREAADVSGDAKAMAAFYKWALATFGGKR